MHSLRGEVLARGSDVLGRDPQPRSAAHRRLVIEAARHRDHHAAARDAEVERLVQALAAVLGVEVAPGHTEVGRAILHVGRHVGGPRGLGR